jgi:hypothetical protein
MCCGTMAVENLPIVAALNGFDSRGVLVEAAIQTEPGRLRAGRTLRRDRPTHPGGAIRFSRGCAIVQIAGPCAVSCNLSPAAPV